MADERGASIDSWAKKLTLHEALRKAATLEQRHVPRVPPPISSAALRAHSWEDWLAGQITDFAGSMRFVYLHTAWFALWIAVNAGLLVVMQLGITPWDPFPFGLLTLVVSLEAIFLSTFVLIAQNRQAALADDRAQADYEVNVRAEQEVAKLLMLVESLVAHQAVEGSGEAP